MVVDDDLNMGDMSGVDCSLNNHTLHWYYCDFNIVVVSSANRILSAMSHTKSDRQQDSKAAGQPITGQRLSQSTGKSTLIDIARRVVNRVMNRHQLIIWIIKIVKDKDNGIIAITF